MTTALQSQRAAQTAEVLMLISAGQSVQEACVTVGLSYDQFKYWIAKSPEGIEAVRQLGIELQRRQMFMIAESQESILQALINRTKGEIETKDLLSVAKYLDDLYAKLSNEHGSTGINEDAAKMYLQGPKQQKGTSRLRGQTINVSPRDDGSVDITTYRESTIIDLSGDDVDDDEDSEF